MSATQGRGVQVTSFSGQTTQFDDILIEKGIITKEQALVAKLGEDPTKEQLDSVAEVLVKEQLDKMGFFDVEPPKPPTAHELAAAADIDELDELEDDGLDDEAFMAEYRDKRLAQMREQVSKEKYGTVEEIVKADWTREVNDASQECWVLVHLYQTYAEECGLMGAALDTLAAKFRALKIVKIKSTAAVENFPDKNLPALFMYHEGSMQHQLVTLNSVGGRAMRPVDLEWHLSTLHVLSTHLEMKPPPPAFKLQNANTGRRVERRSGELAGDDDAEDPEYGDDDLEEYANGA